MTATTDTSTAPHGAEYQPAPWTVEAIDAGFKVVDANGQSLAYVYGHADPRDAGVLDEARRIAANIAKLLDREPNLTSTQPRGRCRQTQDSQHGHRT
jgi:hypothetical protein